jgi:hypothetical protein
MRVTLHLTYEEQKEAFRLYASKLLGFECPDAEVYIATGEVWIELVDGEKDEKDKH